MAIWFNTESAKVSIKNKRQLKSWVKRIISNYNYKVGTINYILVKKDDILEINKKFLNHFYHTDIITFGYNEENNIIDSDIFICPEIVEENSIRFGITFNEELKRVIIHGIFHLVGFSDNNKKERNKMRNLEDAALKDVKDLLIV